MTDPLSEGSIVAPARILGQDAFCAGWELAGCEVVHTVDVYDLSGPPVWRSRC